MQAAPAVDAALGDGRRERVLAALVYGLSGATMVAWLVSHATAAFSLWLWLLAGVVCYLTALVGYAVWPAAPGRLRWTGQEWRLADGEPLRQVSVQIDLGAWMLLRFRPRVGRSRWAGVSAGQAGSAWHDLRIALQFHAGEARPAAATSAGSVDGR